MPVSVSEFAGIIYRQWNRNLVYIMHQKEGSIIKQAHFFSQKIYRVFFDVGHDVIYVENEVLNITGKMWRRINFENMPPTPINCFTQKYAYFETYNKDIESFSFTFSKTIWNNIKTEFYPYRFSYFSSLNNNLRMTPKPKLKRRKITTEDDRESVNQHFINL